MIIILREAMAAAKEDWNPNEHQHLRRTQEQVMTSEVNKMVYYHTMEKEAAACSRVKSPGNIN